MFIHPQRQSADHSNRRSSILIVLLIQWPFLLLLLLLLLQLLLLLLQLVLFLLWHSFSHSVTKTSITPLFTLLFPVFLPPADVQVDTLPVHKFREPDEDLATPIYKGNSDLLEKFDHRIDRVEGISLCSCPW